MNGTIDEVVPVNLNMAGNDEFAVNVREVGVIVYDAGFVEQWRFDAPTTLPKNIAFEDIDNDGGMDFALAYNDRVAVYDRSSGELFGVYIATGPLRGISIGNYDDVGTLDVISYARRTVYCISDGTTPPAPQLAESGMSQLNAFVSMVVIGPVLVAIPVGYGIALPLWVRRKRKQLDK
jgi:hypothetical protein